jgi:tetratricopeptide (TPR) repeat protein
MLRNPTHSFPSSADGLMVLAAILWATSAPAIAAERDAKAFAVTYETAIALFDSGNYADALVGFDRAYALRASPEPVYMKARCLHALARLDEAVSEYERFLSLAPTHATATKARGYLVEALRALGERKLSTRDFAAARATFERSLVVFASVEPAVAVPRPQLLAGLGDAFLGLGDLGAAVATLERALAASPSADLRPRIEASLARARIAPAALRATAGVPGTVATTAPTAPPPKKKRLGLYLAMGGGAAAVVAAGVITAIAVAVSTKWPTTDLGWQDADGASGN